MRLFDGAVFHTSESCVSHLSEAPSYPHACYQFSQRLILLLLLSHTCHPNVELLSLPHLLHFVLMFLILLLLPEGNEGSAGM